VSELSTVYSIDEIIATNVYTSTEIIVDSVFSLTALLSIYDINEIMSENTLLADEIATDISYRTSSSTYTLHNDMIITEQNTIKLNLNQTFDGNNHTITIDNVTNYKGMFSNMNTAPTIDNKKPVIKNLNIRIINSSNLKHGYGWIVAKNQKFFTVINCSSDGPITQYGGGICGMNSGRNGDCSIHDSYSTGQIEGSDSGGICGKNCGVNGNAIIQNCYSIGNIGEKAGGICGMNTGMFNGKCIIKSCYSIGSISIKSGGICGMNSENVDISMCYSTGDIDGGGGISGDNTTNCGISQCYSTGDISNGGGGISGQNTSGILLNNTYTIWDCYSAGNIDGGSGTICGINTQSSVLINNTYTNYTTSTQVPTTLNSDLNITNIAQTTINTRYWFYTNEYPILITFRNSPWEPVDTMPYHTQPTNFSSDIIAYSNICLTSETLIKTDQGELQVHILDKNTHTINGKKIKYITKTLSTDDTLICIKRNAIRENVPSIDTIMSQKHKVLIDNIFIESNKLSIMNDDIIHVPYNGEYLYNIMMYDNSNISANNLILESLHISHYKSFILLEILNYTLKHTSYDSESISLIQNIMSQLKISSNVYDINIYNQFMKRFNYLNII
jgi:hypothetical protein